MNPEQNQIRVDIYEYLMKNNIMTLATAGNDPWVCAVYYGMDEDLNLYILTGTDTKHAMHLKNNHKVAFSIFDSHIKITDPKYGIQGKGVCKLAHSMSEITKGASLWHKFNPGSEKKYSIRSLIEAAAGSRIYKITPTYIKFFNKDKYGDEAYGIYEPTIK